MKYLLPCPCGQSVEVEPNQAGQTVPCGCGQNLTVPSMLQMKALPAASEKPIQPPKKREAAPYRAFPYRAACINLTLGFVCAALWGSLGYLGKTLHDAVFFYSFFGILPLLYVLSRGLTFAFLITALALLIRDWVKSPLAEDTTLRRTFFVLGVAFLFPGFMLGSYLYEWQPHPRHATLKRTQFSFGSYQRMLPQDSTPIPFEERQILWMTDDIIDEMMPMELFFYFQTLASPTFSYNFQENYEAVKDTYLIWVTANIIFLVLAHLSVAASFFMPRQEVIVTGWSGSDWH